MIVTSYIDGNPLLKPFNNKGIQVITVNRPKDALRLLDQTICYFGDLKYDLKHPFELLKLKGELSRRGIPYVYWNRDAPWNEGWKKHRFLFLKFIKPVNIYLAHSSQTSHLFHQKTELFPNAAENFFFNKNDISQLRQESNYQYDVSFIGSTGNKKWRACNLRAEFFNEVEKRIRIISPNVRFKIFDTCTEKISKQAQVDIIKSTKINLNYGAVCDLPSTPSWGLPERVFGIAAAGGFLLTDYRKTSEKIFNKNLLEDFQDIDGCVEKINFYLDHFNELRNRAEALHQEVLNFHTYDIRAEQFLNLVKNYRA